ncbi:hypothetical protein HK102_009998, partial [Quaeritorhiza haematococci]
SKRAREDDNNAPRRKRSTPPCNGVHPCKVSIKKKPSPKAAAGATTGSARAVSTGASSASFQSATFPQGATDGSTGATGARSWKVVQSQFTGLDSGKKEVGVVARSGKEAIYGDEEDAERSPGKRQRVLSLSQEDEGDELGGYEVAAENEAAGATEIGHEADGNVHQPVPADVDDEDHDEDHDKEDDEILFHGLQQKCQTYNVVYYRAGDTVFRPTRRRKADYWANTVEKIKNGVHPDELLWARYYAKKQEAHADKQREHEMKQREHKGPGKFKHKGPGRFRGPFCLFATFLIVASLLFKADEEFTSDDLYKKVQEFAGQ